ncbi:MAG: hypothetical protein ACKOWX_10055 [Flavobacteriales bacterium]
MKQTIIVQIILFMTLFGCDSRNHVVKQASKKQHSSMLTQVIANEGFNIKVNVQNDDLSVEIIHGKKKNNIKLANNYGKLTFTSALSIVAYSGEQIHHRKYLFCKRKFLIFPFEDWNGNLIFYKIPLKHSSTNSQIHPLFVLNKGHCLFNERSNILLASQQDMKEYIIAERSIYMTTLTLFDFGSNEKSDTIVFQTAKQLNLPEDASPKQVKQELLNLMSDFCGPTDFNAFFR